MTNTCHATPFPPRRRSAARPLALLLAALIAAPPGVALAGPSGAQVTAGRANVSRAGNTTRVVTGRRAIIEWDDFDIGTDESVRFIQPDATSSVLNRVMTPDPTQIDGALLANGRVYIANPYGVYYGENALVDVGELVTIAGHIADADFMRGIDRFTRLEGTVENLGEIHADSVLFAGRRVANHGYIAAPEGALWMLAGDSLYVSEHGSPILYRVETPSALDRAYAVENTGTLEADSVRMAAGDLLSLAIHNRGTIRAREIALAARRGASRSPARSTRAAIAAATSSSRAMRLWWPMPRSTPRALAATAAR